MSYDRDDYWRECVEIALDEAGVKATPEQIKQIAWSVQGGAENIGQAFHRPENPLIRENERLHLDLRAEREKVACRECGGRGRIITAGPYHSSDSECSKCQGEGKHTP